MADDIIPPGSPPVVDAGTTPSFGAASPVTVSSMGTDAIDQAGQCYDDACRAIKAQIDAAVGEGESVLRAQQAAIAGQIDVMLDQVEKSYLKAYLKAASDAGDKLTEAYAAAQQLGIPVPDPIAFDIAAQTGDYLGSNYVVPVGNELIAPQWPADVLGPNPVAEQAAADVLPVGGWVDGRVINGFACTLDARNAWLAAIGPDYVLAGQPVDPSWTPVGSSTSSPCLWQATKYLIPSGYVPPPVTTPVVTPPPPPPPPVTLPPVDEPAGPSCPVPSTLTQCQIDTSQDLFNRGYDELTTKQKTAVDCLCKATSASTQPNDDWAQWPQAPSGNYYKMPNWCSANIVAELANWQLGLTDPEAFLRDTLSIYPETADKWYYPPWLKWLVDTGTIGRQIAHAITGGLDMLIKGAVSASKLANESLGQDTSANLVTEAIYTVFSTLHKIVGFPPGSWLRSLEKTINWQAPENVPGTAESIEGYLSGAFDEDTSTAYIRAANDCQDPYERLRYSRRTRPNVSDAVMLYMTQKISETEFRKRMRENGVITDDDLQRFVDLVNTPPPISDLIRFLVRDVADEDTVAKYELDTDFEQKWQGNLIKYADAQGFTVEEARYYWRAHWEFPSPTQLYEMLHRLRPGVVPKELEVTADMVAETLGINDYNPVWQRRLMAVSYNPITRTDAQRAFSIGALDSAGLKSAYLDIGYASADADTLVRFTTKLRDNQRRAQAGVYTAKDYLGLYTKGTLSLSATSDALLALGWSAELVTSAINAAKEKRAQKLREKKIAGIRGQYLRAEIYSDDVVSLLAGLGLDATDADYLLEGWDADRNAKAKHLSASQLCKYWSQGLISADDYQAQLLGMGYAAKDVIRIAKSCGIELSAKLQKAAEQEAAKAARAAEKAAAQAQKAIKDAQKCPPKPCPPPKPPAGSQTTTTTTTKKPPDTTSGGDTKS